MPGLGGGVQAAPIDCESKLLDAIVLMSRAQMPRLFGEYDQVWRW